MKIMVILLTIFFSAIFNSNSIKAQKVDLFIVNDCDISFQEYYIKYSSSIGWDVLQLNNETLDIPQSFSILLEVPEGCYIDLKAFDGKIEYTWVKINVCDAYEVSLFINEAGECSYEVSYMEDDVLEDEELK